MKKEWIEVPDDELNFYEEMLVALLGTLAPGGYNLKEGGSSGKWCEEAKQKFSESQTGDKNHMFGRTGEGHPRFGIMHTEEAKGKMSESHKGKTLNDEHKQHISETLTGRTLTDERKQNISNSLLGDKNNKSKKVYQYTINGTFIQSFASSGEAARSLNKNNGDSNICACANDKRKSAYGFKWSYMKL